MLQHARFVVLTGHLREYPLSDIIGILRHQRKTGRLLIEYSSSPGALFFNEGELVDAQMGSLRGVQVIVVAMNLPDAAFNFNPMIHPSGQSIDNPSQRTVLEMLGCWQDEIVLDTGLDRKPRVIESGEVIVNEDAAHQLPPFERLALPEKTTLPLLFPVISDAHKIKNRKPILTLAGALLLLATLFSVTALPGMFGRKSTTAVAPVETAKPKDEAPARAPSESIDGPNGFSDLAHGASQPELPTSTETPATTRAKVKQLPRNQMTKKLETEVASPPSETVPAADGKPVEAAPVKRVDAPPAEQAITVVTQVEDGRVVQAYVANRRAGMEAFEASALRAARQRRYPPGTTGSQKVKINIGKH